MEKTSIFLVSRSELFREALKSVLRDSQFEVVGTADDVDRTESNIKEKTPQVVLLDLSSGPEYVSVDLKHLRSVMPDARIVVLTEALDSETLAACLAAGADGYLIQDISADALLQSLSLVMLGEKVFPTQLAPRLVEGTARMASAPVTTASSHGLSEHDVQILQRLVHGDSNKMIANRLNLTEATIKVHLKSLVRRINVKNRTQAAVWAHKNLNMPS